MLAVLFKKRYTTFLAAFAMVALLALPSHAQDRAAEIQAMLEGRDAQIKTMLQGEGDFTDAQREQLRDLVNNVIDFEAMGQQALGRHWADLTEAQRTEFVEVFSEIVRSQSLADLDPYRAAVTYENIDVEGDAAHVVTSTVYKENPITVEYKLGFRNDQWMVDDIILDEVSTAEGYARSFQSVVRKRGFETLMKSLRKKRDQVVSGA